MKEYAKRDETKINGGVIGEPPTSLHREGLHLSSDNSSEASSSLWATTMADSSTVKSGGTNEPWEVESNEPPRMEIEMTTAIDDLEKFEVEGDNVSTVSRLDGTYFVEVVPNTSKTSPNRLSELVHKGSHVQG